jgi:hypothetical protein
MWLQPIGMRILLALSGLKAPTAVREQNMVVSPVRLGTNNHYAGEGQQQFTGLDWTGLESVTVKSDPLLVPHFKTSKSLEEQKYGSSKLLGWNVSGYSTMARDF